jgi:hypothetical protein
MGVTLVLCYLGLFKESPDTVETGTAEKTKIAAYWYLFSTFRAEHHKDPLYLFLGIKGNKLLQMVFLALLKHFGVIKNKREIRRHDGVSPPPCPTPIKIFFGQGPGCEFIVHVCFYRAFFF